MKKHWPILLVLVAASLGIGWWYWQQVAAPAIYKTRGQAVVTSFEDCVAAGNPVMESYPRRCNASDQSFVENIGNALELADVIVMDSPKANQKISSPLAVSGQARGTWYFEAQFSGRLVDEAGTELGIGIFTAQGEWMTENFVPFSGTIEFSAPNSATGKLLVDKNNPSGLPEHDAQLVIPVRFR